MLGDDEIKEMHEHIALLEKEIEEKRKELNKKKYNGIRAALEARKDADKVIMEELRKLGYNVHKYAPNWMF